MGIKETLTKDLSREVMLVILVLGMCSLWVWAFGKVPIIAEHDGFVLRVNLPGDVQTIVGKDIDDLRKQSSETSKKIDQTASKVDNIKVALDAILADYYSKRVKEAVRQRCKLPLTEIGERDRLWDQINRDLNLYRVYSGDRDWQRPSCGEV